MECNDETAHLEWFPPGEIPALSFPYPAGVLQGDDQFVHFEWDDAWVRPPE